jgi:hypothetical protein
MDQIIETLEQAAGLLEDYEESYKNQIFKDGKGCNQKEAASAFGIAMTVDKLTILIDQFKDAKKWVDEFITHNTEGEPVTHLVEDPSGGETLADPPATEEDDLKELNLVEEDSLNEARELTEQLAKEAGIDLDEVDKAIAERRLL